MSEQTLTIEELKPSVIQAQIPEGPCRLRNPETTEDGQGNNPVPVKRNTAATVQDEQEDRKSRIPLSKFRQTDKVRSSEPQPSDRPPQPRLRKNLPTAAKSNPAQDIEKLKNRNTVEDFERLFGDLNENGRYSCNSDILKEMSPADPNQIDNYFEQIIDTYNKDKEAVPEDVPNGVNEPKTPIQETALDTPTVLENFDDVLNTYVKENNLKEVENIAIVSSNHEEAENAAKVPQEEVKINESVKIATIVNAQIVTIEQEPVVNLMETVQITENTEIPPTLINDGSNPTTQETLKPDCVNYEIALHPNNIIGPLQTNKYEKVQIVDTFVPLPTVISNSEQEKVNISVPAKLPTDTYPVNTEQIEIIDILDVPRENINPDQIEQIAIQPDAINTVPILQPKEIAIAPVEIVNISNDVKIHEEMAIAPVEIVNISNDVNISREVAIAPVEIVNIADDVNVTEEVAIAPVQIVNISNDAQITEEVAISPVEIVYISNDVNIPKEVAIAPVEIVNISDEVKLAEEIAIAPVEVVNISNDVNIPKEVAVAPVEIDNISDDAIITDDIAIAPVEIVNISDDAKIIEEIAIAPVEIVNISDDINIPKEVAIAPVEIVNISNDVKVAEDVAIAPVEIVNISDDVNITEEAAIAPVEIINIADDVNITEEIAIEPVEIVNISDDVNITEEAAIAPVEIINIADDVNITEEIAIEPVEIVNISDDVNITEEAAIAPVEIVKIADDVKIVEEIAAPVEIVNVEDNIKIIDEVHMEPVAVAQPGEVEAITIQPVVVPEVRNDDEKEIDLTETYEQKSVLQIIEIFEGIKSDPPQSRIPRRFNRNIKVYPMMDDDLGRKIEPKTRVPDDVLKIQSIFRTMKSIENEHLMREAEKTGKPEIIGAVKKNPAEYQNEMRKYKSMPSIDKSDIKRSKSRAEMDLGTSIKGRVEFMINKINSIKDNTYKSNKPVPKKQSVFDRIAAFEQRKMPTESDRTSQVKQEEGPPETPVRTEKELQEQIEALKNAKSDFGSISFMPTIKLSDGNEMPVLTVGTALLDPELTKYIIMAAIDLGYRSIDSAFIYGNEKLIGEGIRAKIEDGTVKREDLFIINKLWSTFHRSDLVEVACRNSLEVMGLEYFDLYMIHNPMSFKEGPDVIPKIANVLQFSTSDYLDAWHSMEVLVKKKLARSIGVSNFNSQQIARVYEKAARKPVVNQVESHPYLNQLRLEEFCAVRNIKMSCYATLGTKGTPAEYKTSNIAVIDDPLIKLLAASLGKTPAQMLIRYQLDHDRNVVVKSSSPAHLWENLQSLKFKLTSEVTEAINALNKNKRYFNFKGMGDTHRNYPFTIPF